jgi:hypothetical protein
LLDHAPTGFQLKERAVETGINKSTAHRFLSHLEDGSHVLYLNVLEWPHAPIDKITHSQLAPSPEDLAGVRAEETTGDFDSHTAIAFVTADLFYHHISYCKTTILLLDITVVLLIKGFRIL